MCPLKPGGDQRRLAGQLQRSMNSVICSIKFTIDEPRFYWSPNGSPEVLLTSVFQLYLVPMSYTSSTQVTEVLLRFCKLSVLQNVFTHMSPRRTERGRQPFVWNVCAAGGRPAGGSSLIGGSRDERRHHQICHRLLLQSGFL